jgi:hypothetical protein
MRGSQGVAGHLRAHLTSAPDDVREDGEPRATRRALETPDGEPAQPDPDVLRVARQAAATATGGLVLPLKAAGQDEGAAPCEERRPIAKDLEVRRFAPEIDGDGAVFWRQLSRWAHGSPLCHQGGVS